MVGLIVYVIAFAMTLGGFAARAAGDTKAEQLLAEARAALGGNKNLNNVHGLTATGAYQREMGDRQLSGEITVDLVTQTVIAGGLAQRFEVEPFAKRLLVAGQDELGYLLAFLPRIEARECAP